MTPPRPLLVDTHDRPRDVLPEKERAFYDAMAQARAALHALDMHGRQAVCAAIAEPVRAAQAQAAREAVARLLAQVESLTDVVRRAG